jgi:hypothetical protein
MSKRTKRTKRSSVWIMSIVHGVDDYKMRGRSPWSEIFVYSTEKGARAAGDAYIRKKFIERFEDEEVDEDDDEDDEEDDDEDDGSKSSLVSILERVRVDGKIDPKRLEKESIELLEFYATEAEFIPCKWQMIID